MSSKKPFRLFGNLGVCYDSDSENESLQNDAIETPLVKSEESGTENLQNAAIIDSQESAKIDCEKSIDTDNTEDESDGRHFTPHELKKYLDGLNNTTSNLEITTPRPQQIVPGGSRSVNLPIAASWPNPIIPRESGFENLQMGASQLNSFIQRKFDYGNLQIGAPQFSPIVLKGSGYANLQIGASRPNPIIPRNSGYEDLQISASVPTSIIPRGTDANLPTGASLPIGAPLPNPIIPRDANLPIGASLPIPIIPRESAAANLQFGAFHTNPVIKRASKNVEGTSAPNVKTAVEQREGESDLEDRAPISEWTTNENPVDITPEKKRGVLKVIKKEGTGVDNPGLGDKVAIHYEGSVLINGNAFPFGCDKQKECTQFTLGRGEMIKGLDLAVSTMRKEESAFFIIDPLYAYGETGYPPHVPPNATLLFQIDLCDWKPEDLSPKKDCSILRRILVKGEGTTFPNEGSKVKIQLLGRYNGEVFEERVQEFILGEGSEAGIPDGIEHALYKFHLNETSIIFLKGKYTSTVEMAEHGIPPNSPVYYEVTLVSFEKVKDVWEMNSDEKYEKAVDSREKGIKYTKADNFKVALKHFKWIVTCLEKEPGVDPNTVESRNALLLSGYLNIALCFLKLENYKDTIKFCDKALKMQPGNEKALFRKGQAKMLNNDSEEAMQEFITVSHLYPANKAARHYILTCQEQIKREKNKDKGVYKQMFEIFVKQDQERMKNMKTETGVWQNENGEVAEHHYLSETERLIEQNNSLLRDANIIELSSNVCEKF